MNNTFWAFVSLIIFFAVVAYFRGFRRTGAMLDQRAQRIRQELEEARELKEEAKQQLAEYQRRRREAEEEAKDIVAAAKREAEQMLAEARQKNDDYVTRRTAMAESKIAQAENDAIAEVRSTAVNVAIAAAGKIISERNQGEGAGRFIDSSIEEVRRRLN